MNKPALERISDYLRFQILRMTHRVGSGHPTTSFSAVELAAVLFFKYLRYDLDNPDNEANDRVIFSKGHASALLYALYHVAGKLSEDELLRYREKDSPLEGHPTALFPYAEAATGSLGQGLSIGAGISWAMRSKVAVSRGAESGRDTEPEAAQDVHEGDLPFLLPRVYVLMGDGELAEGSVWEAAAWAAHKKLNHLIAVVDVNRFGQSGETMYGHDLNVYRDRFESFGWGVIAINGHDFGEIDAAFEKALVYKGGPVAILARTVKGKGITLWEDQDGWHNRMLPRETYDKALERYSAAGSIRAGIRIPELRVSTGITRKSSKSMKPAVYEAIREYDRGKSVATKQAFGNALVRLARSDRRIVVLDGDVANSLHTDLFRDAFPDRFLEMYISEQNMAGVATGLSRSGYIPVIATFSAFLTRAHDQFRMMPLSGVTAVIDGSYAGVSVGRDGPSQMGLEDISLFRSIRGSAVLYPADPYSSERLLEESVGRSGITYVRTTREPTPVLYKESDRFPVGGSKVWRVKTAGGKIQTPRVTVISAGITLHEALKAQKMLAGEKITIDVVDAYSIKPIDGKTLRKLLSLSLKAVVAEDHYPEGGLGEAVLSDVADIGLKKFVHLAVREGVHSASATELLKDTKIDAQAIAEAVHSCL